MLDEISALVIAGDIMRTLALLLASVAILGPARADDFPAPTGEGDILLKDFKFASGDTLAEVRMHYRAWGKPLRNNAGKVTNAVLILHGTTGSGEGFLKKEFAGELFGKGQPLDAEKFYIIIPDSLGHGESTRPSSGLRAKFPHYGYHDMIHAQHRLLTEGLKVNHLRLVMGTSMGGMHTWLWGETHPDFMDALMPLACLPAEIAGRNRAWRRTISDAIRNDPAWEDGNYKTQPPSLKTAAEILFLMSSNPTNRQKEAPTRDEADKALFTAVSKVLQKKDANDVLYALEASRDYNPAPDLKRIKAPLLAINFADDLINPPELGILEKAIKEVPRGRAIVIPQSEKTNGHQTHTLAAVWKEHLVELLKETK